MVVESINFHFWPYCNFTCKYCFARFEYINSPLSKKQCCKIIKHLANVGIKKINFAGGEPTLSPFLGTLLEYSKGLNFTTSIISNGTGITQQFIEKNKENIDWIGLSIDSGTDSINKKLGRGNGKLVNEIIEKSNIVKNADIKLKINTVVSKLNFREDLSCFIEKISPERWKIFQILEIKNQNNLVELLVTDYEFKEFAEKHRYLRPIIETNELMSESYLMIDPLGRLYKNTDNSYIYSNSILNVGFEYAFNEICFNYDKYIQRGGIYAW